MGLLLHKRKWSYDELKWVQDAGVFPFWYRVLLGLLSSLTGTSVMLGAKYHAAALCLVLFWLLAQLERTRGIFPSLNTRNEPNLFVVNLGSLPKGLLIVFMCQGQKQKVWNTGRKALMILFGLMNSWREDSAVLQGNGKGSYKVKGWISLSSDWDMVSRILRFFHKWQICVQNTKCVWERCLRELQRLLLTLRLSLCWVEGTAKRVYLSLPWSTITCQVVDDCAQ